MVYKSIQVEKSVWRILKQLSLEKEKSINSIMRDILTGKLKVQYSEKDLEQ